VPEVDAIDVGPGAGEGGKVVADGRPGEVAAVRASRMGEYLGRVLSYPSSSP
jgi:excinuclease ABC subunit A